MHTATGSPPPIPSATQPQDLSRQCRQRRQGRRRDGGHRPDQYFDPQGNLTSSTDAIGRTTKDTYDSSGNLISVTSPAGNVVTMAYDRSGHMTSQQAQRTTADGAVVPVTITQVLSPDGNTESVSDPSGQTLNFGYDTAGQQTSVTDRLGNTTRYEYGATGNRVKTTYPDGSRPPRPTTPRATSTAPPTRAETRRSTTTTHQSTRQDLP